MKNNFDVVDQAAIDVNPERAKEEGIARLLGSVEKLEPIDTKKIFGTSEPKPRSFVRKVNGVETLVLSADYEQTLYNACFPKARSTSNKKQTKSKGFERD